jgi:hypothetical protein
MTYRVWEPIPPIGNLQHLTDQELKIVDGAGVPRAVWDLNAIQLSLNRDPALKIVYSTSALESMSDSLKWDDADMRKFIGQLTKGRYEGSRWCYAPKGNTPHAADVYCMGFSRFQGVENQKLTPWIYLKFSIVGPNLDRLYIFSAHPDGQY